MSMKFEDGAVGMFRLPQHEMQQFAVGWASEAERVRLADRPAPIGK
jgi:hypothetical protein